MLVKMRARPSPDLQDCVVSRDSLPGALFSHTSGRSFRVEDTCEAAYCGNRLSVGQLGNGSTATVTMGAGDIVTHIEVTNAYERRATNPPFQPIQVDANHLICEVCIVNPAVFCCNCKNPPALLCDNRCFGDHQGKDPIIPHSILPTAALIQCTQSYTQELFLQFPICGSVHTAKRKCFNAETRYVSVATILPSAQSKL